MVYPKACLGTRSGLEPETSKRQAKVLRVQVLGVKETGVQSSGFHRVAGGFMCDTRGFVLNRFLFHVRAGICTLCLLVLGSLSECLLRLAL